MRKDTPSFADKSVPSLGKSVCRLASLLAVVAIFAVINVAADSGRCVEVREPLADPIDESDIALCHTNSNEESPGLFASMHAGEGLLSEHFPRAGLRPFASLTAETWRNTAGGRQAGDWWNALLDFGLESDVAKLGGPEGSSVLVQGHWVRNRSSEACFAETTGAFNPVSNIMAADHLRIFNFYYRQAWGGSEVALKFGQLALDDDFMRSDYAGLFLNSAFGAMTSQVGTFLSARCGYTSAFPIYPVASPGVWVQKRLEKNLSWQGGLYYGGPGPDTSDNRGSKWLGSSHAGAIVFTEITWTYLARGAATLRLGGSYHSGLFEDYGAIQNGRTDTVVRGLCSFYTIHDLVLVTTATGQPKLAVFGRAGISPQQDRSVVTAYADTGFNWFAPLPGRSDDIAGVGVSCSRFGQRFRAVEVSNSMPATETTIECTYKARVASWLAMQVDAQFLFNPAPNLVSGRRETAIVLGLRTEISL